MVLNVAEDHLDWHGSMDAYARDKARALNGRVAVVGLDDPVAAGLLEDAAAAVRVGFRLGDPAVGELGVRDGVLVDNAFADGLVLAAPNRSRCPGRSACSTRWPPRRWPEPSTCRAEAIAEALAAFHLGPHRAEVVAEVDGVTYVDDSKATNPHAAHASIAAYPRVVWIAGGQLKGASVDDLVARVANRLVGAVLIGRDRALSQTRYRDTPRMSPSWRL